MSKMARTDEIDELVSSVRDFVSHKDSPKDSSRDRLMLTPELRVADAEGVPQTAEPVENDASAISAADDLLILQAQTSQSDRDGLEATIAELEAAVTAQSDDWEPDGGEEFEEDQAWAASAFTPSRMVDEAEAAAAAAAVAALSQPVAAEVDSLEAVVAAKLTHGMDADALRALVVATVHEELSGELGERITRNVRKLVRREINRVLTSRELDQD